MRELREDHEAEEASAGQVTPQTHLQIYKYMYAYTRVHVLHKNSGFATKMVMKCINAMLKCQRDTPSQNQIRSRLTL